MADGQLEINFVPNPTQKGFIVSQDQSDYLVLNYNDPMLKRLAFINIKTVKFLVWQGQAYFGNYPAG